MGNRPSSVVWKRFPRAAVKVLLTNNFLQA